ncbi:MAG TPA: radical SAM protein [Thermoleophilaceae bacterium]|nr:radical SAM protein [Thermoleophilaceae bacterium]
MVDRAAIHADSADIYINTRCNFGCETCFLGDDYFARDLAMGSDEVAAIGGWLVDAGVRDVAILGGEPTLHPEFLDVMTALRQVGVGNLRLITNGTPRARRLLDGPLDGLVDLTYVSLDGASAEVNDALRGKGTFRHAMLAIELLRDRGMPFVITSTLGAAAVNELDALLELAEASDCQVLNLHWLSAVGRARYRDLAVHPSQWREVVLRIADYTPRRRGLTIECQVGALSPGAPWSSEIDPRACAVRERSNLQFMPDGRVFSCGLLVDTPTLAAYHWDGTQLLERAGRTELRVCTDFCADGCPARQALLGEPATDEHLPVCIYERVVRVRES